MQDENRTCLAIDSSSTISGYAIFRGNTLSRYSSIDKSAVKNSAARIPAMIHGLLQLIDTECPGIVVIEEPVVVRNPQTQRILTMIVGAVYGKCIENAIQFEMIRPTVWRKYARGEDEKLPRKREELKQWGIRRIKELYGIDKADDNIADAILIGTGYLNKEEKE